MIRDMHFHDFIHAITSALDAKDPFTNEHARNVSEITCALCDFMGLEDFADIHIAAHLHDIGKIGVKDRILQKPGALEEWEYKEIQRHSRLGARILKDVSPLKGVALIVRHHHERVDGRGYPDGLAGEDIPLGSRIIAVADALDAMTSMRPYRRPMPFDEAMDELRLHGGTQFDADIVAAAVERQTELRAMAIPAHVEDSATWRMVDHDALMHSRKEVFA
jgi:HD-GYP domain-containing protein (c-di-GMP phosphodiesterase class II)